MSIVDKRQFLIVWFKECMERGKTVVQKLNNHDYIIDDEEEQKDYSSSADSIVISMDERIEMFKYFMNKYSLF